MQAYSIKFLYLLVAVMPFLPMLASAQTGYTSVKVYNLHPKPIVKAMINGKPAFMLLDTGSDIDLLHSKYARKYNFSVYEKNGGLEEMLATVNGMERNFGVVYDLDLVVGERRISGSFISMDIGNIVISIRNRTGVTISGIIGSGTMKSHCFIIDYEKELVVMKTGRE